MAYKRNGEIKPGDVFPQGMQRVALGVEYAGAELNGFQRQSSTANTVQQKLEHALSQIANESISLVCAGRTDAGVHATGQVVHFDTVAVRPEKSWLLGGNTKLPESIRITWAKNVAPDFHARFSAGARSYRYIFHCAKIRSAILGKQVAYSSYDINFKQMEKASKYLLGEHDFEAFRSSRCQANNPVRKIESIEWCRQGDLIAMQIKANAFLHHMVRNIVGTLLEVGVGKHHPEWVSEVLVSKDRCLGGATADPFGLYLTEVDYPKHFYLPRPLIGPAFFKWDDHSPV